MNILKNIGLMLAGAVVFAIFIAILLLTSLEKPPRQDDLHWKHTRSDFIKKIEDADSNDPICISVGAHVSSERGANKSLAKLGRIARILNLPVTAEWAEEIEISTRGHAWLNILSKKERILTVGLWPEGLHVNRELDESPEGWMTRCLLKGEAGRLIDAIDRRNNVTWTGYFNCSSFAADVWNELFPSERITNQPVKLDHIKSLGEAPFTRLVPPPPSPWGIIQTSIGR
jgi:hypothetical protein